MANISAQSITVKEIAPGILEIINHQIYDNGIDMSDSLVFERSAAEWLARQLIAIVSGAATDADVVMGFDHFSLFVGGSDWQPFFHVHNTRDSSASYGGKTYTLAFTETIAHSLITQLQAHV